MPDPVRWHGGIFELDAGLGLASCVAHHGAHVYYQGACQALPRGLSRLERVRLTAQDRQGPEPKAWVDIDHQALAQGIAEAIHSLMEQRRASRSTESGNGAVERTSDDTPSGTPVPDGPHRVRLD